MTEVVNGATDGPGGAELSVLLQRFHELSPADQLAAYERIRDYLSGDAPIQTDPQADERAEALRMIGLASADVNGGDVTIDLFNASMKRHLTGWKSGRVIRAFGTWRLAKEAFGGGMIRPTTRQRGLRRAQISLRRTHEDYLTSLRLWLRSRPLLHRVADYDSAHGVQRDTIRVAASAPELHDDPNATRPWLGSVPRRRSQ